MANLKISAAALALLATPVAAQAGGHGPATPGYAASQASSLEIGALKGGSLGSLVPTASVAFNAGGVQFAQTAAGIVGKVIQSSQFGVGAVLNLGPVAGEHRAGGIDASQVSSLVAGKVTGNSTIVDSSKAVVAFGRSGGNFAQTAAVIANTVDGGSKVYNQPTLKIGPAAITPSGM